MGYRLPHTFVPLHYTIRLIPILCPGEFHVKGFVSIELKCLWESNQIILNSNDIKEDLSSISLLNVASNEKIPILNVTRSNKYETLIIELCPSAKSSIKVDGIYNLSMNFIAQLTDQMKGFYFSSYFEDGIKRFAAVTQMEPTDARRVFPCFDEPNMKATFSLSIGHHRSMISLSNMPLENVTPIEDIQDYVWDHFAKSVPMSTYLVAAAVADYSRIDAGCGDSNGRWNFSIYVRHSAINQTKYVQKIATKIQSFYENYFKIPFPLPKQDIIAIRDFSVEAMENWGLIVHSEIGLLFDEKLSSTNDKQYVLELVAHELAHQWFGNLVTMDWWNDLWLNEGFANYVQYLGAHYVEPDFGMLEQIVTTELHETMAIDYFESSHPISQKVEKPAEINEIFDFISYRKGASLIRMLVHFIGENAFKEGVTDYLESRKYANAVQNELWDALSQSAIRNGVALPTNVRNIMESWTLQKGYPVVTLRRRYSSNEISISQDRFKIGNSNNATPDDKDNFWWIPVTYTCDFINTKLTWLEPTQKKVDEVVLDWKLSHDQWIIANIGESGYYRVNYDKENWKLITSQLMKDIHAIPIINRAQILDDAFYLARAGLLAYETVLNLSKYLSRETEYLPWHAAWRGFEYILSMLSTKPEHELFKKHLLTLIKPIYNMIGFDRKPGDEHIVLKQRALIIRWSSHLGLENCIENCVAKFNQWMEDTNTFEIEPDLKETIIATAINQGSETEWNFAFQRYSASNVASEQLAILSALCSTRESSIIARMLEWTIETSSVIPKQDGPLIFRRIAANEIGRKMAFKFLCERWNELIEVFLTFNSLADIIGWITESFNSDVEYEELNNFVAAHEDVLLEKTARSTRQIIERVQNNVEWVKNLYSQVKDWLSSSVQI